MPKPDHKKYSTVKRIKIFERTHLLRCINEIEIKTPPGEPLDLNHLDVSLIRDFSFLFSRLKRSLKVGSWDVSNARSMRGMFEEFEGSADIEHWSMQKVENINHMFMGAHWDHPLNLNRWDVSNVINAVSTFMSFKGVLDVSNWKLDRAESLQSMFQHAEIPYLDLSKWSVTSVKDFSAMFAGTMIEKWESLENWSPVMALRVFNMFSHAKTMPTGLSQWRMPFVEVAFDMMRHSPFEESIVHWNIPESCDRRDMFCGSGLAKKLNQENPSYDEVLSACRADFLNDTYTAVSEQAPDKEEGRGHVSTTTKSKKRL